MEKERRYKGNVEMIEYLDHASATDISERNYDEYYLDNNIKMASIGLIIHEDDEKIHLLHEITRCLSPREAPQMDKIMLDFNIIIKGAITERTVLKKDVLVVI